MNIEIPDIQLNRTSQQQSGRRGIGFPVENALPPRPTKPALPESNAKLIASEDTRRKYIHDEMSG